MARNSIKTKAIVLKRINYKDADKIITLYTSDLGKITAIAKGVRKIESKKRGFLEPFNIIETYLIKSGKWYIITQTSSITSFGNIRKSNNKIYISTVVTDVLNNMIPEEEQTRIIFPFIEKTFEAINKSDNPNLLPAFLIKVIKLSGFYSHSNLEKVIEFSLDLSSPHHEILNYLQKLLQEKYESIIENEETTEPTVTDAIKIITRYFEEYIDIKFKSLSANFI